MAVFCLLTSYSFQSACARSARLGQTLTGRLTNIAEISQVLFTTLLLPFEVTSILILVAILGAVVLARKEEQ